jgi:hypothetical protein
MSEGKKKMATSPVITTTTTPTPFIWITGPDGSAPVKCCFNVGGVVDPPGSYIHVSISQIADKPIKDTHPCYVWADGSGNWSAFLCLPTPPTIPAGTVVRIRACLVNPTTGEDTQCMDTPVALYGDCPPATPTP